MTKEGQEGNFSTLNFWSTGHCMCDKATPQSWGQRSWALTPLLLLLLPPPPNLNYT